MYMPYTTNPHLPRLRMEAAKLVLQKGWSSRQVARHTGFHQSTIVRWVEKAKHTNRNTILTENCRPYHHPKQLSDELVAKIIDYRQKYRRCAKVLHYLLLKDGYLISLSSIERVLRRFQMVNHSKWKKWHQYLPRPEPERPGILVEIDTIFDGEPKDRLYVYTLLDVCSRWAYASPQERINTHQSLRFIKQAQTLSPFFFQTLQSDHGSEFSSWFTKRINEHGLSHRHSRVRKPSDNGHLERFNRTLQEECLNRIPHKLRLYQKEIPEYLHYYNTKRPHMGLSMRTPLEVMRSY
jgi:transposase InsO family protein